jgi:TusA-related sulfurtransferase
MPDSMTSSSPPTPSSSGEQPDAGELDLRGEICPFTFVRTRLALEALPLGSRLRILLDHEPASRNVPRSAREWGQHVHSVTGPDAGIWTVTLEKRVA